METERDKTHSSQSSHTWQCPTISRVLKSFGAKFKAAAREEKVLELAHERD
jgi:hypothetical protein